MTSPIGLLGSRCPVRKGCVRAEGFNDLATTAAVVKGDVIMRSYVRFGRPRASGVLLFAVTSAGLALGLPTQAWAATRITVCASKCDYTAVQDAINAAPSGAVIMVGPGTYPGNLTIAKSLALVGAGADQTTIGATSGPIITVNPKVFVTINGVTGTGAQKSEVPGAGISNAGILLLSNSMVIGNLAPEAVYLGNTDAGGIANTGVLTLQHTTLAGNIGYVGGGLLNSGTATLNDSTVTGNRGVEHDGGISSSGVLLVNDSTIGANYTLLLLLLLLLLRGRRWWDLRFGYDAHQQQRDHGKCVIQWRRRDQQW
jgi:hypothetical protein